MNLCTEQLGGIALGFIFLIILTPFGGKGDFHPPPVGFPEKLKSDLHYNAETFSLFQYNK